MKHALIGISLLFLSGCAYQQAVEEEVVDKGEKVADKALETGLKLVCKTRTEGSRVRYCRERIDVCGHMEKMCADWWGNYPERSQ